MLPAAHAVRVQQERLLPIEPQSKAPVYTVVFEASEFPGRNHWLESVFLAGIATLGLVLNRPAVAIGAMLISRLMGPVVRIRYESQKPLGLVGEEMIVRALLSARGPAALRVELERRPPPQQPTGRKR